MKKSVVFIVLILGLSSVRCSEYRDAEGFPDIPDKDVTETPKSIPDPVTLGENESFNVHLEGMPQPNTFRTLVKFNGDRNRGLEIRKIGPDKKVSRILTKDMSLDGVEDFDLRPGETYTYLIGLEQDGDFQVAASKQILVTPDLVIDGSVNETNPKVEIKNQFRIFFKNGAVLKTLGRDVHIEVEEIYSEGGKLQTFSESDAAPVGQNGHSSGFVTLKAKKVTGPFAIEIRGQRGGQGMKGATGLTGSAGTNSTRKVNEGFEIINYSGGVLCLREYFDRNGYRFCPNLTYEQCRWKYHPGVGGQGGPGSQGHQGERGLQGGDALESYLDLPTDRSNINVVYKSGLGGTGGEGGDGGSGGPGGQGGPRENVAPGKPCDPPPQGPTGESGPRGPNGQVGPDGKTGRLFINGELQ